MDICTVKFRDIFFIGMLIHEPCYLIYDSRRSNDRFHYLVEIDQKCDEIISIFVYDSNNDEIYDQVCSCITDRDLNGMVKYKLYKYEYVTYKIDTDDEQYKNCAAWRYKDTSIYGNAFSNIKTEDRKELISIMRAESIML